MPKNKVVYGTTVLIDLTADSVTADKLATGATAHDAAGEQITGELVTQTCYTGDGEPVATLGAEGDIYLDMSATANIADL